jgi:hypothetical protein
MQRIVFLLFFSASVCTMNAQKVYAWMDAGVKFGYGLTGMLNSNLFDDKAYEHHLTTGYSFGGKLGLFFGLYDGITFDFLLSTNNQDFDYLRGGKEYLHDITWKNLDLAVLYRMQKDGLYLEIGPMISFVNKVEQNDQFAPQITDVKEFYSKNYISGIFGIGGYIFNYEQFTTMLGLRLGYGFTDMINDEGKKLLYPTPSQEKPYSSKSTNAAFVQLSLEFNFALGYYGRSACSKRASLFKF